MTDTERYIPVGDRYIRIDGNTEWPLRVDLSPEFYAAVSEGLKSDGPLPDATGFIVGDFSNFKAGDK